MDFNDAEPQDAHPYLGTNEDGEVCGIDYEATTMVWRLWEDGIVAGVFGSFAEAQFEHERFLHECSFFRGFGAHETRH